MSKLLGIATHAQSRALMESHEQIEVRCDTGLVGDFRGRAEGRNVVVLSRESWEAACAELDDELPWTTRRGNLLLEGVELANSAGMRLQIGEVVLRITGECLPCGLMDKFRPGLRKALTPDWRAGVECSVLTPGTLQLGDGAQLDTDDSAAHE